MSGARVLCLVVLPLAGALMPQGTSAQEVCGNHRDDDGDGDSDCYDADCAQEPDCGPQLPPPFRDCGVDPTTASLKCDEVPCPFP